VSPTLLGMGLGLFAAVGVLLVVHAAPPLRPIRLEDRLAPYLRDTPTPSRLLSVAAPASGMTGLIRRLAGPSIANGARAVDRLLGGRASVRRRLAALGSDGTVEDFRIEQVIWAVLGLGAGAMTALVFTTVSGTLNLLSVTLLCGAGLVGGVLGRDWWLTQEVKKREQIMLAEFPIVAELLALAVTAGESPVGAIDRVCRLSGGQLGQELAESLGRARAGIPLVEALQGLVERTSLTPLARFVDGLVIALERGTPLAEVLRAQAADVREASKRELLDSGGRKEIAMMVPVVFLVLPVTVLFALFPGLISIVSLAS